jgi:hypothetical protein
VWQDAAPCRLFTARATGAFVAAFVAGPAAYGQAATQHVVAHIAGGYAEPVGRAGDVFDPGWIVSGGAIYEFGGKGHIGGSVSAGVGGYSRYRTVTQPILVGGLSCDPTDQARLQRQPGHHLSPEVRKRALR